MSFNQNKSCVKSCQKTLLKKKPIVFQNKTHCFPTCALFLSHCFEKKHIKAVLILTSETHTYIYRFMKISLINMSVLP